MKYRFLLISFVLACFFSVLNINAKDGGWADFSHYKQSYLKLISQPDNWRGLTFIGNSITYKWNSFHLMII